MPGPEVYAGCPFMGRFAGRGLEPSQTVKKLHSCLFACVGATIGRPSTCRSNAFSGKASCKANGHGRAMLAPTRVFRQSDRVNLSFNSCCCIISRFPKAFSYQMLSAKVISIIFVCVLSSWLVVQFLLLFSVCIYLSLIIFVFSLQQKAAACMLQAAAK